MNVKGEATFKRNSYITDVKLRNNTISIITILLVVSLVGLVFLQYYLLTDAIALKEQTFKQNVLSAMNSVASRLEASEAAGRVFQYAMKSRGNEKMRVVRVNIDSKEKPKTTEDSVVIFAGMKAESPRIWYDEDSIRYLLDKPGHVILQVYDAIGRRDSTLIDKKLDAGDYSLAFDRNKYGAGEYFFKLRLDSNAYTMNTMNGAVGGTLQSTFSFEHRTQLVGKVVESLVIDEQEPISRRINQSQLDSLIRISLNDAGISLPYAFGVLSERTDSLQIVQPQEYSRDVRFSPLKARLFPGDFLFSTNQLLLFFPDKNLFLLKQVGPQLALTVILTSVLVFCFVYAVRTITKQKAFAIRLTDFINNMTHEFKTPISTISVAAETIMRPEVIENKEKVARYGMVIHDENIRMKHQVDKILQMAVIEEGDYELKLQPVDVHEIIAKAVENIALHVDAKGGSIGCAFQAEHSMVEADIVHLSNIIHNVLDNANKYSPDKPTIMVSTENRQQYLIISIKDQGIGIRAENLKNVFDKYYRVPTGNRHDVKGFGLGLSYVKLMTEAHRGMVMIESEEGNGTTVRLQFPLSKSA